MLDLADFGQTALEAIRNGPAAGLAQLHMLSAVTSDLHGCRLHPGLAYSTNFSVTAGVTTSVALPMNAYVGSADEVEDTASTSRQRPEVSVYGLSQYQYTTDAFLGLQLTSSAPPIG